LGEATTVYLYSQRAIPRIFELNPDARIICCFRNPVDAAHAFHSELLYRFTEDVTDFEKAWRLQDERRQGRHIPHQCWIPSLLQYRKVMSFPEQLERVYRYFPPEQVTIILFEDLVTDTAVVYQQVLSFLDLPDDCRQEFPVVNFNRSWKWEWLGQLLVKPPDFLRWPVRLYKKVFNLPEVSLKEKLIQRNSSPVKREVLSADFRAELTAEFSEDIDRLAQIIGRDLSHWKK
jgi:hypothetical protein